MKISCVLSEEEVNVDHMERVEFHMIDDHGWVEYALCAEDEPDSLFVQGRRLAITNVLRSVGRSYRT